MSRLLPQNLDIRGFNVTENVNATVPDGTVTSSIPLAEIPLVKKGIFYVGNNYTLDSSDVRFTGIAKATTDENGMGISPSSPESVTLLAGLEVLNRYKTIPPFKGTLVEYIDMVLSTVGYTGKRQVWWDSTREPLLIQGYSGNVFEYLSAFLTTLGYDMVWQGDYIAIYPWKRYIIDPFKLIGLPQITYTNEPGIRFIKVRYYDQEWRDNGLAFPIPPPPAENPQNLPVAPDPILASASLSVDNLGQGLGAYTEQTFDISASLKTINKIDETDPLYDHAHPNKIRCSLPPAALVEDTILAYLAKWQPIGMLTYEADSPADYTTRDDLIGASTGEWSLCVSNNVFYYCTVGSDGTESALWAQWASFIGDRISWDALEDYIQTVPDFSYYTITGANGYPMMPEMWDSHGGVLEVEIAEGTNQITVKLWGANLAYPAPVFKTVPNAFTWAAGGIVGFDISGRVTPDTIYFIWDESVEADNKWVLDDSIDPYPYAPYRVAYFAGKEYEALVVTGEGIFYTTDSFTFESSRYVGEQSADDVTTEIDNRFITSIELAVTCAMEVDRQKNGQTFTLSATLSPLNAFDWFQNFTGTYISAFDFMVYTGYDLGQDTYSYAHLFFTELFGRENYSYQDVNDWLLHDSIAFNLVGKVASSIVYVPNRGAFRIESATISPTDISISGSEDTTFGDVNRMAELANANLVFGDMDSLSDLIEDEERVAYTFGMNDQEPLRFN